MDVRKTLVATSDKIGFGSILSLVAVLYISVFFFTGDLLTKLPNNWFTSWLGGVFTLMDKDGFFNVWSGQTQGTHYLYFLLWKPAQALAGDQWYFTIVFSLLWYIVSIGALFLSFYFFYKIVEHIWDKQKALILGLLYIILSLSFDWYTVIDSLAIAGLLGAILYILKGRVTLGAILLGISVTIKPMGILLLPVILKSEFITRKAKTILAATSISTIIAFLLPFVIGNFKIFISSFNWQSGRPPWETVYAFFMWLLNKPYPTDPFFNDASGIQPQDWGWTGITPVHSIMTTPVPSYNSWYNSVFLGLVVVAVLGFLLFKRVRTKEDFLWGSLYGIGTYFICFYGWSNNFFFWVAPFLLFCFPLIVSVSFRIICMLEYPLFYGLYLAKVAPELVTSVSGLTATMTSSAAIVGVPGYWSIIVIRTAVMLAFVGIAWRKLSSHLYIPFKRERTI